MASAIYSSCFIAINLEDASNPDTLILNIENVISIAPTVFATDCIARMEMGLASQEVKETYVEPMISYMSEYVSECFEQINSIIQSYLNQNDDLIRLIFNNDF